jgi:hypothetical protein
MEHKKATPVKPNIDVTNQCGHCRLFFEDKDVAITDDKGAVCLDCLEEHKYVYKNIFGEYFTMEKVSSETGEKNDRIGKRKGPYNNR